MDQSLDPLFAQRFAEGQANLPPAALQMLLQSSAGRGAGFGSFQQTPAAYGDLGVQGVQPQLAPTSIFSQLLSNPQTLAQLQSPAGSGQPDPRPTSSRGRARSGGAGAALAAPVSYASRHQQAEARRRSRINERLEALRKVVPHSERANTATFLEDVLKYVERLQRRVVELEERLGLEPTVKYEPPPRLSDGNTEPSTADNLASQPQQQTANRGTGRGIAAQQAAAIGATAQQARAPQQEGPLAAAAALEQQLGAAMAGRASVGAVGASAGGSFPARAGLYSSRNSGLSTAAAGGEALPSNSEELALEAALQKGSSAAPNMAESRPSAGHAALAQLAQQAHLQALAQAARSGHGPGAAGIRTFPPQLADLGGGALGQGLGGRHLNPAVLGRATDLITAQDLAAATAAVARPGAAGVPRPTSPLSNSMLQQAAQALLSNPTLLGAGIQGQQAQQQVGFSHQQQPGQQPLSHAALLLAQQQTQQQAGLNATAFDGQDQLGAQGGSLLPGLQSRASEVFPGGLSQQQLQAQHAQQLQQLLAAQQAEQASHQQQLQQLGLPRALGGAMGPAPPLATASGQSAPLPSVSACLSGGTPAAPAAAAAAGTAAGKELSNSGRSQQTQHGGGGVGMAQEAGPVNGGATQGERLGMGAGKRAEREELVGGEPKRKRLPARPTVSV